MSTSDYSPSILFKDGKQGKLSGELRAGQLLAASMQSTAAERQLSTTGADAAARAIVVTTAHGYVSMCAGARWHANAVPHPGASS